MAPPLRERSQIVEGVRRPLSDPPLTFEPSRSTVHFQIRKRNILGNGLGQPLAMSGHKNEVGKFENGEYRIFELLLHSSSLVRREWPLPCKVTKPTRATAVMPAPAKNVLDGP